MPMNASERFAVFSIREALCNFVEQSSTRDSLLFLSLLETAIL